jgi:polysaccharide chain length determinant protein (PEP-CTERM system associated)
MLGHRELTMEDYADIFKRRYLLILISTIVLLVIGVGLSFALPRKYESQTLILIEQQRVPENYVKPVVDEDLTERLASMKEQILSRSRIEPIITKYNLFAGGSSTMDDRVEKTQKAIKITQIRSEQTRGTGMPGFFVTFVAQDARTAQLVCGDITSLFVSENLNEREQHAEGTSEFLKQQLDNAKSKLDEQDAKLADFQRRNFGRLPGQEQSNTNTLQALTTQLDAVTQSLNRTQQEETFIEAVIAQQKQEQQNTEPITGVSVDERKKQIKDLTEQKQALESEYTADYPDVVAISRKIADLKAEMTRAPKESAPAAAASATNQSDSPELLKLKLQLRAAQQSMVSAKQEQARLQQQIRNYEGRVESSPAVEEEFKQVTRDHDTALQFYNSLLTKMNESSMATALEHRQQGEQFRVMDAPNLPDSPKFPNPYVFAGGGLGAGMFLGLLVAGLLEYRDTSLRSERDIWAFTKLPTLATISFIDDLPQPVKHHHGLGRFFSRSNKPTESALG